MRLQWRNDNESASVEIVSEPSVSARDLIEDLNNARPSERQRARHQLLTLARDGVPLLEEVLLNDPRPQVRWEAARLLMRIRDPRSAVALVSALSDHHVGVQWMATRALVALGPHAIDPLLRGLLSDSGAVQVRNAAHFVLRSLRDEDLKERTAIVLVALEGMAPDLTVPLAARQVLDTWPPPQRAEQTA